MWIHGTREVPFANEVGRRKLFRRSEDASLAVFIPAILTTNKTLTSGRLNMRWFEISIPSKDVKVSTLEDRSD